MRKLITLLVLFVALTLPSASFGQDCISGASRGLDALDHEELTVSNTAIGFTDGTIKQSAGNAAVAVVTVETDQIRYWVDGTTPTTSSGHLAEAGSSFVICGLNSIDNFLAIRVTLDAAVKASFFKAR